MDEITISSSVKGTQSQVLKFQNPYLEPISASITLLQQDNFFNLMLSKRQAFEMGPMDFIDIPITFSPKEFQSATAQIIIQTNQEISWNFPVRGIPEIELPIKPIVLEGKAREKVSKDFEVELIGRKGNVESEQLLITFESSPGAPNHKEFLKVTIKDIKTGPSQSLAHFKVVIFTNKLGHPRLQKAY